MSTIRIKGLKNTTALGRGEEVEVERTSRIDRLIAKGFVLVVREPKVVVPQEDSDDTGNSGPADVELTPEQLAQSDVDNPPNRNETTAVWLDYVRGLQIEEPDDAKRDKLQADYDEYRIALANG